MLVSKYKELFRIQLRHEYYTDLECQDFSVSPTAACAELLKSYKLKFRTLSDGAAVYYEDRNGSGPVVPLSEIPAAEIFSFYLELKNLKLLQATSLGTPLNNPVFSVHKSGFYFDSAVGSPLAAAQVSPLTQVLILPGSGGSSADGLPADSMTIDGQAVEVVTCSAAVASTATNAVDGLNSTFANLSLQDEFLTLELRDTIPVSTSLKIWCRKGTGTGNPNLKIECSRDGVAWKDLVAGQAISNTTSSVLLGTPSHTFALAALAAGVNAMTEVRYVRFTKANNAAPIIQLDYVGYNYSLTDANTETHNVPVSIPYSGSVVNYSRADVSAAISAVIQVYAPEDTTLASPILTVNVDKNNNKFEHQFDLNSYPAGKYTFRITPNVGAAVTSTLYVDNDIVMGNVFGVMDIRKPSAWNNVHSGASGQTTPVTYIGTFTPIKTVWRYYIIQRSPVGTLPTYAIRDDEDGANSRHPRLLFSDLTTTYLPTGKLQGYDTKVFVSVYQGTGTLKPVRLYEETNADINLYKGTALFRTDLPNPAIGNYTRDTSGNFFFSDVYIYV